MTDPLDQYDYVDTDFMDESSGNFAPLIGQYIIDYSYLELGINILVADLINDRSHELGYIITAKMGMFDKIELLERIAENGKFHRIPQLKKIIPIIPKLKDANTFRNRVAHAIWATMKPSGVVRVKTKVDRNQGVWFQNIKINIETIEREIELLEKLTKQVYELHI